MKKTFTLIGFLFSTNVFSHENFSEHKHIEQTISSNLAAIESPAALIVSQAPINELMMLAMLVVSIVSLALIIRKKIVIKD
jgi:hypothetical protein